MTKDLPKFTVPSLTPEEGAEVAAVLQGRLGSLIDLALTLKHVHWNVVGPHFIAVHEMLDPQVDEVNGHVDEIAERIATLGVAPLGTPGAVVAGRTWEDYPLAKATVPEHLHELEKVYTGVITSHRQAADAVEKFDGPTADLLKAQILLLEKFQWFVRAHLEDSTGALTAQ